MIVDYNYKPYVEAVTISASAGVDTIYTPPFKNNKGFICIAGSYSGAIIGPKKISFYDPNGSVVEVPTLSVTGSSIFLTGSLNDFYAQFTKESTAANAYDINFIRQATQKQESCFFPIVYNSLTFESNASAVTRPIIVITLY